MKNLKAFADVGNVEAMTKERWGASKWVMGQFRVWCANEYNKHCEPEDLDPEALWSEVSHKDFMKMLDSAWHKDANDAHLDAILKRTAIIVDTDKFWYVRLPGEEEVKVKRLRLGNKIDFLREGAGEIYIASRGGNKEMPPNFAEAVAWEEQWMAKAMDDEGEYPPVPFDALEFGAFFSEALDAPTYFGASSSSQSAGRDPFAGGIPPHHRARLLWSKVKEELLEEFHHNTMELSSRLGGEPIELDPSTHARRRS